MYRIGTPLSTPRGLYRHKGVAFPDGMVLHASKERGQVVLEPLSVFSEGRPIRADRHTSRLPHDEILRRGYGALGRPYRPLTANCEHLVAEVLGLEHGSPQLRTAFAFGCLALGLGLAIRSRAA
jgi:hypothetical protein